MSSVCASFSIGLRTTAWDNPLVEQHPEWYSRDLVPSDTLVWTDIIDFDYSQPGIVRVRCRWLWLIDFWNNPPRDAMVFMLAEWEERDLHAHWTGPARAIALGQATAPVLSGDGSGTVRLLRKNRRAA